MAAEACCHLQLWDAQVCSSEQAQNNFLLSHTHTFFISTRNPSYKNRNVLNHVWEMCVGWRNMLLLEVCFEESKMSKGKSDVKSDTLISCRHAVFVSTCLYSCHDHRSLPGAVLCGSWWIWKWHGSCWMNDAFFLYREYRKNTCTVHVLINGAVVAQCWCTGL